VRDKDRGLRLLGLVRELLVTERGFRLLIEHRFAGRVEEADPRAIGVAMALYLKRIGASRSQNVARIRAVPAVSPNSRHMPTPLFP